MHAEGLGKAFLFSGQLNRMLLDCNWSATCIGEADQLAGSVDPLNDLPDIGRNTARDPFRRLVESIARQMGVACCRLDIAVTQQLPDDGVVEEPEFRSRRVQY